MSKPKREWSKWEDDLLRSGVAQKAVAAQLGISKSTVQDRARTLGIAKRKKIGRDPHVKFTLYFTPELHAAMCKKAHDRGVTMNTVVRAAVQFALELDEFPKASPSRERPRESAQPVGHN